MKLTDRQESCLYLLVRGKTVKEIAKDIHLSPRTVEDHLTKIKEKMNCKKKSELIEKAINLGFLYYIPQILQNHIGLV